MRTLVDTPSTVFQHTAARRRLQNKSDCCQPPVLFQHTAARRRLHLLYSIICFCFVVSTHSRAEAAAAKLSENRAKQLVSTHSRAEAAALLI